MTTAEAKSLIEQNFEKLTDYDFEDTTNELSIGELSVVVELRVSGHDIKEPNGETFWEGSVYASDVSVGINGDIVPELEKWLRNELKNRL